MVQMDNQVVVIGGKDEDFISGHYQKAFYKLNCVSQGCTWQSMIPQLSVARFEPVAVVVPDNFVNCPLFDDVESLYNDLG